MVNYSHGNDNHTNYDSKRTEKKKKVQVRFIKTRLEGEKVISNVINLNLNNLLLERITIKKYERVKLPLLSLKGKETVIHTITLIPTLEDCCQLLVYSCQNSIFCPH